MMLYRNIFEFDIIVMNEVLKKYGPGKEGWEILCEFYKDPDGYSIDEKGLRRKGMIECTVDGLLSIRRIYAHEGFNEQFIQSFSSYREIPIVFFPKERGGINTSRYSAFGDRIDHTLFDIKQYYEHKTCKLESAYLQPKTKEWLDSFKSFEELVKWMNIDGIFVDEKNNVIDLEKNNGEVISDFINCYDMKWSEEYYRHVKNKIDAFRSEKKRKQSISLN